MALDGFDTLARLLATAVLNGVWQGMALTALTWIILHLTPRSSASTRHGIWSATLAVVLALPVLCLTAGSPNGSALRMSAAPLQLASHWPALLLAGWALVAALMLGRLAWSYGYVRWLQRTATPLGAAWQQRAARLTGCRPRVYASNETQVPVAIGFWRPAILIPDTLLDQLTQAELDHIVLHEWAHVRRRDQWTNCAHELAQALFFFNPAVWFIGRALRLEREIACDDSVVGSTGAPVPYAGCLAKLVELNSCPPVSLSPGAAGDVRLLFLRVERLLHWQETPRFSAVRFTAACALLVASAAFVAPRLPALVDIPGPSLALREPLPAIEAGRRALVSEERIRAANILMETAAARLASADRMLRAARQQVRMAGQIAQGASGAPVSRVACQQPAGQPGQTNLNKI